MAGKFEYQKKYDIIVIAIDWRIRMYRPVKVKSLQHRCLDIKDKVFDTNLTEVATGKDIQLEVVYLLAVKKTVLDIKRLGMLQLAVRGRVLEACIEKCNLVF